MFDYRNEAMGISAAGFDGRDRELLLGRRTYEIFEAYWPVQPDDDPIARTLNAARKHVASRTLTVVLARGKRLFGEAAKPFALRLVRSRVSTTGRSGFAGTGSRKGS